MNVLFSKLDLLSCDKTGIYSVGIAEFLSYLICKCSKGLINLL